MLDCLDRCAGTPPDAVADAEGCSCVQLDPDGDDDADGVLNCIDACAATPATEAVDITGCTIPTSAEDPPAESPADGDDLPSRDDDDSGASPVRQLRTLSV